MSVPSSPPPFLCLCLHPATRCFVTRQFLVNASGLLRDRLRLLVCPVRRRQNLARALISANSNVPPSIRRFASSSSVRTEIHDASAMGRDGGRRARLRFNFVRLHEHASFHDPCSTKVLATLNTLERARANTITIYGSRKFCTARSALSIDYRPKRIMKFSNEKKESRGSMKLHN